MAKLTSQSADEMRAMEDQLARAGLDAQCGYLLRKLGSEQPDVVYQAVRNLVATLQKRSINEESFRNGIPRFGIGWRGFFGYQEWQGLIDHDFYREMMDLFPWRFEIPYLYDSLCFEWGKPTKQIHKTHLIFFLPPQRMIRSLYSFSGDSYSGKLMQFITDHFGVRLEIPVPSLQEKDLGWHMAELNHGNTSSQEFPKATYADTSPAVAIFAAALSLVKDFYGPIQFKGPFGFWAGEKLTVDIHKKKITRFDSDTNSTSPSFSFVTRLRPEVYPYPNTLPSPPQE